MRGKSLHGGSFPLRGPHEVRSTRDRPAAPRTRRTWPRTRARHPGTRNPRSARVSCHTMTRPRPRPRNPGARPPPGYEIRVLTRPRPRNPGPTRPRPRNPGAHPAPGHEIRVLARLGLTRDEQRVEHPHRAAALDPLERADELALEARVRADAPPPAALASSQSGDPWISSAPVRDDGRRQWNTARWDDQDCASRR